VVGRRGDRLEDRRVAELPELLAPGDLLVANDTRVMPARLEARRETGGRIELLVLAPGPGPVEVMLKPSRRLRAGERLFLANGAQVLLLCDPVDGVARAEFPGGDPLAALELLGTVPLPPYLGRAAGPADRERYQTVFARVKGSVAAPTAGLHFTPEILEECRRAGAEIAYVTLHVGLGTFQPIHTEQITRHHLHAERYEITPDNRAKIEAAARRVAVGTTSVRTLESMARGGVGGETDLFIYPGFEFQSVGAILTNFHLPKTSLLLLVCAFGGREFVLDAYRHAVAQRYRFYSYGDCMLIV
ncbi:MAG TPA: tRNA preQ1(34) S-adenosylmethionine ribosyltransferase-isomerase QueA, partial [Bryobacteraceae bacterium]|nr:tRNA preQ1(34) S-adenosylmethionine ribosyltransferase-isomerase QueA [Bryobacteraceae bacterium]